MSVLQSFSDLAPHLLNALVRKDEDSSTTSACPSENGYDGRMGVRVSAIFVIMFSSSLGALFPVLSKQSRINVPEICYFTAKFFGSGVIIATSFIHLLSPAVENLGNDCLGGTWTVYPWAIAICMMTIFLLFFIEVVTYRFATFESLSGVANDPSSNTHTHTHGGHSFADDDTQTNAVHFSHDDDHIDSNQGPDKTNALRLADDASDAQLDSSMIDLEKMKQAPAHSESMAAQMTAVFVLESGIIFHSVFIGLSLAIAGEEFNTLYIVLVFHQGFEGLGLGTRLAATPWAPSKRWVPIALAVAFGLTTPIAIAIGLGVRESYSDSSRKVLISNGIFDSISSGILIYTGLVELMAHEFLFSHEMKHAPFKTVLLAFGMMCAGAALMALLGRWA
ncbi:Zinc/iron permease [Myxozyma melibiosi]|uniref:Zinc/iron permease n=1 Tax=Myxozyma melibiosi TaxID=54550 RepID=A0ABR1F6L1_9ASCO